MKLFLFLFLLISNVAIAQMKCSPLELKATSTLKISLPPKETKGTDLVIINPQGKVYTLALGGPETVIKSGNPGKELLGLEIKDTFVKFPIKQEEYAKMQIIEKKVLSFIGHINDRDKGNILAPIFTVPGKYSIKASPNLETEDPIISGECFISYKP